ncbi:MAG: hypothetical protein LBV12_11575 [Puniceicoccales bacterium]|jgi:hypothetical protein|nr:hypothetical protein [Puniceicoccales bacterium]
MKSSLKQLILAASCLAGVTCVHAQQYTTLEPVGNTTTKPEYLTVSTPTRSTNVVTESSSAAFGKRMNELGAGLIGRSYIYATYDYVNYDDDVLDNTNGATVRANFPLINWLDIGVQYSYQGADDQYTGYGIIDASGTTAYLLYDDDLSANFFWADLTFHTTLTSVFNIKPYARAAIGVAYYDYEVSARDFYDHSITYEGLGWDDTVGMYATEIGVEIPIGKIVTISPFAGARWYFDSDYDSEYLFGGRLNVYLTYGFGLTAAVYTDTDSNMYASAGLSFSF